MSDISKSNDSEELQRFFPCLHRKIYQLYDENTFPFKYDSFYDLDAVDFLVGLSEDIWRDKFADGFFSNFVTCFSEKEDCLSQWRGYADNGSGCCIGFSKSAIEEYCKTTNGVLQLRKVIYLSKQEFEHEITRHANDILDQLRGLREWIVEEETKNDDDPETDDILFFNFNSMIEDVFTNSLEYKAIDFVEEDEWRLFFADQGYKIPEFVYGNKEEIKEPNLFSETLEFQKNKIEFRWTENDLIPFIPINFCDLNNPVSELWMGPKNRANESDIKLFLKKYGYENVTVKRSSITYR